MSTPAGFYEILDQVADGHDLTSEQMTTALGAIMDGEVAEVPMAALLTALRVKGETTDEILGAALAMRARATRISPEEGHLLDTCGTGGDGSGTFNISTAVAFVCAAAGATVAKHGNRAISSRVGSADVLEALGLRLDLAPEDVTTCVDKIGIGFLYAPHHHSALKHAGPVRRGLGFRTVLNLLGPMTNPAGATHQLIGVYDRARVEQVATVLGRLGARRALVVHGSDGLDEITTTGDTHAALWTGTDVEIRTLSPDDVGIPRASTDALAGGDAATNAAIVKSVLSGTAGPASDIVRLNAGAALWVGEYASDLAGGVALATRALEDGAPWRRLEALAAMTRELAG